MDIKLCKTFTGQKGLGLGLLMDIMVLAYMPYGVEGGGLKIFVNTSK